MTTKDNIIDYISSTRHSMMLVHDLADPAKVRVLTNALTGALDIMEIMADMLAERDTKLNGALTTVQEMKRRMFTESPADALADVPAFLRKQAE